jgi:hypothetical protein
LIDGYLVEATKRLMTPPPVAEPEPPEPDAADADAANNV